MLRVGLVSTVVFSSLGEFLVFVGESISFEGIAEGTRETPNPFWRGWGLRGEGLG
jgi:hypothetical protein